MPSTWSTIEGLNVPEPSPLAQAGIALAQADVAAQAADLQKVDAALTLTNFLDGPSVSFTDLVWYTVLQPNEKSSAPVKRWSRAVHAHFAATVGDLIAPPAAPYSAIYTTSTQPPVPPKQKKGAAKGGNQQQKGGDKNNKNNNNNKGKNKAEQKKPAAKKKGGEPLLWRLKVVVGSITSCAAHPSDENLLVAQIDIGGGETRQVVSGVAALTTPEAFTGQRVILCTNLKAGDLRGVQSNGRVLVVTGADKKTKSIITPPVGAALGEVVSVVGVAQEPPATCTGKHWSKLMKKFTVAGNVCQYDGLALQTKGGEDIKSTIETGTYA